MSSGNTTYSMLASYTIPLLPCNTSIHGGAIPNSGYRARRIPSPTRWEHDIPQDEGRQCGANANQEDAICLAELQKLYNRMQSMEAMAREMETLRKQRTLLENLARLAEGSEERMGKPTRNADSSKHGIIADSECRGSPSCHWPPVPSAHRNPTPALGGACRWPPSPSAYKMPVHRPAARDTRALPPPPLVHPAWWDSTAAAPVPNPPFGCIRPQALCSATRTLRTCQAPPVPPAPAIPSAKIIAPIPLRATVYCPSFTVKMYKPMLSPSSSQMTPSRRSAVVASLEEAVREASKTPTATATANTVARKNHDVSERQLFPVVDLGKAFASSLLAASRGSDEGASDRANSGRLSGWARLRAKAPRPLDMVAIRKSFEDDKALLAAARAGMVVVVQGREEISEWEAAAALEPASQCASSCGAWAPKVCTVPLPPVSGMAVGFEQEIADILEDEELRGLVYPFLGRRSPQRQALLDILNA